MSNRESEDEDENEDRAEDRDEPTPTGPTESFADLAQPSGAPASAAYTTELGFDDSEFIERNRKPVSELDIEYSVAFPVPDVEVLPRLKHLVSQLHARNVELWADEAVDEWGEAAVANDGGTLYDLTILDVAPRMLRLEGIELSRLPLERPRPTEHPLPRPRFLLCFLRRAREDDSIRQTHDDVEDTQPVLDLLRAHAEDDAAWALPGPRTLDRAEDDLPAALAAIGADLEAFERAVTRAVYAVYRNGVRPPEAVVTAYGLHVEPPFEAAGSDRPEKRDGLRDWIETLHEETLGPLTLHRERPTYDMLAYVGLIATAALIDSGIETAADVAAWDHGFDSLPGGSDFRGDLEPLRNSAIEDPPAARDLPVGEFREINEQFDAVTRNVLDLAHEVGLFDDAVTLAADAYRIDYHGDEEPDLTISRQAKSENDVTEQFTFVVLTVIGTHARFTIGTRMVAEKSQFPSAVGGLLALVPEYLDIEMVVADAELDSDAVIETLRDYAGDDWILSASEGNDRISKPLHAYTPKEYVGYVERARKDLTPSPAGIAYPYGWHSDPPVVQFFQTHLDADDPPSAIHDTDRLFRFSDPDDTDTDTSDTDTSDTDAETSDTDADTDASDADDPEDATDTAPATDAGFPTADDEFDDLAAQSGVPNRDTHATYLTDLALSEHSATDIRLTYLTRWGIETNVNQLKNHFTPGTSSKNGDVRLYFAQMATVLQNWHTLICRAPSPERGIPQPTATNKEVLKAIQHVAFDDDRPTPSEAPSTPPF